ncbi:MAG: hypothetical protein ACTSXD_07105 [Candidatus Heimdallarchaeaceae archaeon]
MINEFPTELLELRESPIKEDFPEIEYNIEEFYLTIDLEFDEDVKAQCLDARNYLDSARILVRNLIDLEENNYVKEYEKKFRWTLDNLGRVDKKIDELETETIEKLERVETYREEQMPHSPKIRRYINFLVKCMDHLVIYPLIKSFRYFQKKQLKNDKDLFIYKIFIELYNSSESLGSISAEKQKSYPKQPGISRMTATHEDEVYFVEPEKIEEQKESEELIDNFMKGDIEYDSEDNE